MMMIITMSMRMMVCTMITKMVMVMGYDVYADDGDVDDDDGVDDGDEGDDDDDDDGEEEYGDG